EWVVVGGDLFPDALKADGVEAHERNGEARPQLLLELGQHAPHRCDEDAPPAPPQDELGEEDAGLKGFAEADGVRDEDARPRLLEGKPRWLELELHEVERGEAAEVGLGRSGREAPELALQVESGAPVPGGGIDDEPGLARVEY